MTRSSKLLFGALALATWLAAGGCFYMTPKAGRLFLQGRYSELKGLMESKMEKGGALRHDEISYLCGSYWRLKRYDKMFACSEMMEKSLQEKEPETTWFWDSTYSFMWGRAFAYIELGNYPKAVEYAAQAITGIPEKFHNPFHDTYATSALALAYAFQGDRANALKYSGLLEKVDTTSKVYRSLQTEKRMEMAKIHMALGDFDQALAMMRRAEKEEWSFALKTLINLFSGASWTGQSLFAYQELPKKFMLAKGLFETGHVKEAKAGYDWLLGQEATEQNQNIYWVILFDRGRIAESEGDAKAAIGFYEKAAGIIEAQRATIHTEASKIGYVGDKQTVYHRLIAALFRDSREEEAFEYVERSKSRALVDLLASKKEFSIGEGREEEIKDLLKRIEEIETEGRVQETGRRGVQVSHRRSLAVEMPAIAVSGSGTGFAGDGDVRFGSENSVAHPTG